MSDRKAVIKNADMSEDMQQDAVDCATQALEKYNIEKDIAAYIKKEFDKKIQSNMALHSWPQLRLLCDSRDKTLYLFLFGTSGHPLVQVRLDSLAPTQSPSRSFLTYHRFILQTQRPS